MELPLALVSIPLLMFTSAIALSFLPIDVDPTGSVKSNGEIDEHDKWIYRASFIGVLVILLLLILIALPLQYPLLNRLWAENSVSPVTAILFIFYLLILGLVGLLLLIVLGLGVCFYIYKQIVQVIQSLAEFRHHRSVRPLRCMTCKTRLKKLDVHSMRECLSRQQQVAQRLGSVDFEVWYCHRCCIQPSQDSSHIRAYVLAKRLNHHEVYRSRSSYFKLCQSCQEITMTKTATGGFGGLTVEDVRHDGGKLLHTYTCKCCSRVEEHSETIRSRDTD